MITGCSRRYWNTLYIYEDDLTWVWSICSAPMIQVRLLVILLLLLLPASILLWLWDQPYQDGVASSWYIAAVAGDETHADMSMMCVRCPNHNLPYSMIQVWPRDSPTTGLYCGTRQIQVRVASIWSLAALAGDETHYIYMKNLTWVRSGWGTSTITYSTLQVRDQVNLQLPVTVRPSKYQAEVASLGPPATVEVANALYVYGVDLIWVWSGWDASIITYSILQVVDSPTAVTVTVIVKPNQVGVASLWPLTAVGGAEVLKLNTYMSDVVLIEYEDKW